MPCLVLWGRCMHLWRDVEFLPILRPRPARRFALLQEYNRSLKRVARAEGKEEAVLETDKVLASPPPRRAV